MNLDVGDGMSLLRSFLDFATLWLLGCRHAVAFGISPRCGFGISLLRSFWGFAAMQLFGFRRAVDFLEL